MKGFTEDHLNKIRLKENFDIYSFDLIFVQKHNLLIMFDHTLDLVFTFGFDLNLKIFWQVNFQLCKSLSFCILLYFSFGNLFFFFLNPDLSSFLTWNTFPKGASNDQLKLPLLDQNLLT